MSRPSIGSPVVVSVTADRPSISEEGALVVSPAMYELLKHYAGSPLHFEVES